MVKKSLQLSFFSVGALSPVILMLICPPCKAITYGDRAKGRKRVFRKMWGGFFSFCSVTHNAMGLYRHFTERAIFAQFTNPAFLFIPPLFYGTGVMQSFLLLYICCYSISQKSSPKLFSSFCTIPVLK